MYDARLGFSLLRPVGDRWFMNLSVTPVVASDFKADQSSALRITGSGIGIYQWSPTTKIVLGVVYLDRQDVSLLPAAGVIWTPNEDWRFELVAPRPRIAWRLGQCAAMYCVEHWAYLGFEFGGGEWAIVRDSGAHDLVTMRDYRFLLGIERKAIEGVARPIRSWLCLRQGTRIRERHANLQSRRHRAPAPRRFILRCTLLQPAHVSGRAPTSPSLR